MSKNLTPTNNLKFNFPEIAKEWHPTKNINLKPEDVIKYTNKKVWWLCPKKHEYESRVSARSLNNQGCPYCVGRKVNKENSLKFLFPKMTEEWHPTKNGYLMPDNVTKSSNKKVWWLCKNNHEWLVTINNRVNQNTGCPYCSGRKATSTNNLKVLLPNIAKEWHTTKNINLKPEEVGLKSNKKVWWLCPKGHEYFAVIYSRAIGTGCTYCANLKTSSTNNLKFNFPEIAKEWHPTKNGDLKPEDVVKHTGRKVWWLCKKGHEWKASIHSRSSAGSGCPKCTNQSSKPELRILSELETLFKKVQSRFKYSKVEIDIYIKDINVGIEYDGAHFHKNKNLDEKKNEFFNNKLKKLIRIRAKPLEKISEYDVIVEKKDLTKNDLDKIVNSISNFCDDNKKQTLKKYLENKSFVNEEAYKKYLSYFPAPIPSKSLKILNPKVSKEWHYEKNYPLTPESFTLSSGAKVWWLCPKGHEYQTTIAHRTEKTAPTGCPYCAGQKVGKENNLKFLFPEIAKEWHYEKNYPLKPEDLTKSSGKKVWWLCSKGHEWKTAVHARTGKKTKCPHCGNHYTTRNSK
jgi:hypothetical protein